LRTSCVPILKMWRNRRGKRKRWRYSRSNLSQRKRVKVVSLLTFISRIQFLLVEISFHVVWKLIHFFRYTARVPRLTLIKSLFFIIKNEWKVSNLFNSNGSVISNVGGIDKKQGKCEHFFVEKCIKELHDCIKRDYLLWTFQPVVLIWKKVFTIVLINWSLLRSLI
jgi:hypothetical protein